MSSRDTQRLGRDWSITPVLAGSAFAPQTSNQSTRQGHLGKSSHRRQRLPPCETRLTPRPPPSRTMFMQRSVVAAARRAAASPALAPAVSRSFATSLIRREAPKTGSMSPSEQAAALAGVAEKSIGPYKVFKDVKSEDDLLGPGAAPGTVPTDLEQSTGLERLEILGKMEGVDIFDMRPLDASRKGTMDNPIKVRSAGDEQFAGCTGYPADSHIVHWLGLSRERPIERCPECGSVYEMEYIGPQDDHHHHHHGPEIEEPKTFADYIKPEYRYR
ncbi:hypothetical protein HIM_03731 [Hirsutella minnesotensis 3608]|uniref:Cytochrome c oxidase subunit 4, mitochondrial n=1 Tax=Hirsutella minnesotensis 3608 TaxID=1043627 RepID=A0A0F8A6C8_9HYPO|nr:hypothetical protein HIM_03731 [Hirsutella minnesotensis 3608]